VNPCVSEQTPLCRADPGLHYRRNLLGEAQRTAAEGRTDERLLAGSGDVGGLFRVTCSFVNVVACLLLICLMSLAAMAMAILGELE
jgi:hypothetical protein